MGSDNSDSGGGLKSASTIGVPLLLVVAVLSGVLGAGVGAGAMLSTLHASVADNTTRIMELRRDIDTHVIQPSHRESAPRLNDIERRLNDLEKVHTQTQLVREDILRIGANVRALCQANKSANCAP